MKAALMNQNTLPIIGSGPLAGAPVASAANQNQFYMSTDFGLCKYVSVFNNSGIDHVLLVDEVLCNILNPTNPYTVCVVATPPLTAGYHAVISITDGVLNTQAQLKIESQNSTTQFKSVVGGVSGNIVSGGVVQGVFQKLCCVNTGTLFQTTVNGVLGATTLNGTFEAITNNIYIGGVPGTDAYSGQVVKVLFYGSTGAVVEGVDFNLWDGGNTIKTITGKTAIVTDGAPSTVKGYACVPVSLL